MRYRISTHQSQRIALSSRPVLEGESVQQGLHALNLAHELIALLKILTVAYSIRCARQNHVPRLEHKPRRKPTEKSGVVQESIRQDSFSEQNTVVITSNHRALDCEVRTRGCAQDQ